MCTQFVKAAAQEQAMVGLEDFDTCRVNYEAEGSEGRVGVASVERYVVDEICCSTQDDAGRGEAAAVVTEMGVGDERQPLLGDAFEAEKRLDGEA